MILNIQNIRTLYSAAQWRAPHTATRYYIYNISQSFVPSYIYILIYSWCTWSQVFFVFNTYIYMHYILLVITIVVLSIIRSVLGIYIYKYISINSPSPPRMSSVWHCNDAHLRCEQDFKFYIHIQRVRFCKYRFYETLWAKHYPLSQEYIMCIKYFPFFLLVSDSYRPPPSLFLSSPSRDNIRNVYIYETHTHKHTYVIQVLYIVIIIPWDEWQQQQLVNIKAEITDDRMRAGVVLVLQGRVCRRHIYFIHFENKHM